MVSIPAAKQPGANRQVQLVYKAKPEQLKIQHTASFAKEAFYIPVTAQAAKRLAKRNRLGAVNDHLIRNILELGQALGRAWPETKTRIGEFRFLKMAASGSIEPVPLISTRKFCLAKRLAKRWRS